MQLLTAFYFNGVRELSLIGLGFACISISSDKCLWLAEKFALKDQPISILEENKWLLFVLGEILMRSGLDFGRKGGTKFSIK